VSSEKPPSLTDAALQDGNNGYALHDLSSVSIKKHLPLPALKAVQP